MSRRSAGAAGPGRRGRRVRRHRHAAPERFYEWRLIVPATGGTGADSLNFHWPRDRLPLRIWVEDAADLPAAT